MEKEQSSISPDELIVKALDELYNWDTWFSGKVKDVIMEFFIGLDGNTFFNLLMNFYNSMREKGYRSVFVVERVDEVVGGAVDLPQENREREEMLRVFLDGYLAHRGYILSHVVSHSEEEDAEKLVFEIVERRGLYDAAVDMRVVVTRSLSEKGKFSYLKELVLPARLPPFNIGIGLLKVDGK